MHITKIAVIFAYIVSIASLVVMTLTLYGIMLNGQVVIKAPYGEAPFEFVITVFSVVIMLFVLMKYIGLNKKTGEIMTNKVMSLSLLFFVIGCMFMNAAHFTTNFALSNYDDVFEANPFMNNMFVIFGFLPTFLIMNVAYYLQTSIIFLGYYLIIRKLSYPKDVIIANVLLLLSIIYLVTFASNFIHDYYTLLSSS